MSNFTPAWFKKGFFNESLFCDDFLSTHQLLYSNGAFFTFYTKLPVICGELRRVTYGSRKKENAWIGL